MLKWRKISFLKTKEENYFCCIVENERRGRSQKFKNFPRIVASFTVDDLWTRLNSKILILLRACVVRRRLIDTSNNFPSHSARSHLLIIILRQYQWGSINSCFNVESYKTRLAIIIVFILYLRSLSPLFFSLGVYFTSKINNGSWAWATRLGFGFVLTTSFIVVVVDVVRALTAQENAWARRRWRSFLFKQYFARAQLSSFSSFLNLMSKNHLQCCSRGSSGNCWKLGAQKREPNTSENKSNGKELNGKSLI